MINLFYEDLPTRINCGSEYIEIITDFREIVRLLDTVMDKKLHEYERLVFILQYFKKRPRDINEAILSLSRFIGMDGIFLLNSECVEDEQYRDAKKAYSFSFDYPYIYAAFLHDYGIDIQKIPYMHWWNFRMLFDGLQESNEIKKRIMYRCADTSKMSEKERRKVEQIQRIIALPDNKVSDFDIGEVFFNG